ncbi:ATP-dependent RNA helicase DbpA [Kangiella koreensis]|uniref:DEAD-box ATP-dependent RNA helicase RhpA n=1 Tax=Kangiella koreensis (strain DSM 16069 / JCM 12317 / KCTC 12182 / SW-125) TaxID=523791 RepID=C7R9E6_KANKD|nr:ATP-dependent RNA helicase DbpA [Kangiella koreensis]ACV26037.1 DEAD/DEAH box helicase domain protein [Kangiella koreensis DSM 16069]
MSHVAFSTLALQPALIANLADLGFERMTPIQADALPQVLEGKDVIAQAKTGSGKTAVFGLGILEKLDPKNFSVQSMVLCPTRELAEQVAEEIRRLARPIANVKILTLCGGTPLRPQADSLKHGAHIVVGTPGRIVDHLEKQTLDLDAISTLVLDEADRMLDMGFEDSMDAIVNELPRQRQTLLFSATYPPQIQAIAERVMVKPVLVQALEKHDSSSIKQDFYRISDEGERDVAVRLLLLKYRPDSTVIFCNTKRHVKDLTQELKRHGFSVLALHGDLEQKERDQALIRFANNSVSIMVATDVAARGLDIDSLDLVINYHIASDPEIHVHRIGRTGRAGNKGHACSIVISKEKHKVARLAEYLGQEIEPIALPDTQLLKEPTFRPPMATIQIDGGKKQKLRPGDILGALTADYRIEGNDVGKIQVANSWAYVAVKTAVLETAVQLLNNGKMKGKKFRARKI